jgi:hypothetical protein
MLDQKRNTIGIDVQTKHIYNLIEMGKRKTLTVNSFKTNQPLSKFIFAESKYPNYYINKLD